jgi:hypothetical protein
MPLDRYCFNDHTRFRFWSCLFYYYMCKTCTIPKCSTRVTFTQAKMKILMSRDNALLRSIRTMPWKGKKPWRCSLRQVRVRCFGMLTGIVTPVLLHSWFSSRRLTSDKRAFCGPRNEPADTIYNSVISLFRFHSRWPHYLFSILVYSAIFFYMQMTTGQSMQNRNQVCLTWNLS